MGWTCSSGLNYIEMATSKTLYHSKDTMTLYTVTVRVYVCQVQTLLIIGLWVTVNQLLLYREEKYSSPVMQVYKK